jgi:hypothetical protein
MAALEKLTASKPAEDEEAVKLRKENRELKEKQEAFERKQKTERVELARKSVNDMLDAAVKDKRMTPAVREAYASQIGVDSDDKVVEIKLEAVKLMCGANKPASGKEQGMVKSEEDDKGETAEEQLITLTFKSMAESGEKDFNVAFARVAPAHRKLHKEYLNANGVKGERS